MCRLFIKMRYESLGSSVFHKDGRKRNPSTFSIKIVTATVNIGVLIESFYARCISSRVQLVGSSCVLAVLVSVSICYLISSQTGTSVSLSDSRLKHSEENHGACVWDKGSLKNNRLFFFYSLFDTFNGTYHVEVHSVSTMLFLISIVSLSVRVQQLRKWAFVMVISKKTARTNLFQFICDLVHHRKENIKTALWGFGRRSLVYVYIEGV